MHETLKTPTKTLKIKLAYWLFPAAEISRAFWCFVPLSLRKVSKKEFVLGMK